MPKVSVIIPVYNVEKYLRDCLDSVVSQTLKDVEIICVDDGSPDNCGAILDEYARKDARIQVIHQENKGLSGARKVGMEYAKGDYIAHIDSDDFIEKDYLQTLYSSAEKHNADVTVAQMKFFNEGQTSDATRFSKEIVCSDLYNKLAFLRNDCQSFWVSIVNKLYNKKLIDKLLNYPNPENINIGEDCLWMLKAAYFANKIVCTTKSCYCYRNNPNSLTHTESDKNKKDKINTVYEIIKFMNVHKFSKECIEITLLNSVYHSLFDKSQYLYFIGKTNTSIAYSKFPNKFILLLHKVKSLLTKREERIFYKQKIKYLKQLNAILLSQRSISEIKK